MRKKVSSLLASAVIALAACGGTGKTRSDMNNAYEIKTGTQLTYKDLRIAVGNVWSEDYTDDKGLHKNGLTANVWVYVRDQSSQDVNKRLGPGQQISVNGHLIRVVDVSDARTELSID